MFCNAYTLRDNKEWDSTPNTSTSQLMKDDCGTDEKYLHGRQATRHQNCRQGTEHQYQL